MAKMMTWITLNMLLGKVFDRPDSPAAKAHVQEITDLIAEYYKSIQLAEDLNLACRSDLIVSVGNYRLTDRYVGKERYMEFSDANKGRLRLCFAAKTERSSSITVNKRAKEYLRQKVYSEEEIESLDRDLWVGALFDDKADLPFKVKYVMIDPLENYRLAKAEILRYTPRKISLFGLQISFPDSVQTMRILYPA